jgi:uncharacterized phage-associated protein
MLEIKYSHKQENIRFTAIANEFIQLHKKYRKTVDFNLQKLDKMIYLAYAWYLMSQDKRLIDEDVFAKAFFFETLQEEFLSFGKQEVNDFFLDEEENKKDSWIIVRVQDPVIKAVIKSVFETSKDKPLMMLVNYCIGEGTPHEKTVAQNYDIILDDDIKLFFEKFV